MNDTHKKYTRELLPLAIWNPDEPGFEPTVEYNPTKINHLTKRYILDEMDGKDMEKEFKLTAYDIAKHHPTGNNILLLTGHCTHEEYLAAMRKGQNASNLFPPCDNDPETWIKRVSECHRVLHKMREQPAEVNLGGLGTLKLPSEGPLTAINALLTTEGLPELNDVFKELNEIGEVVASHKNKEKEARLKLIDEENENKRLRAEVTNLMAQTATNIGEFKEEAVLDVPEGKVVMKKAEAVFADVDLPPEVAQLEIPTWEWDGPHPDVPAIDPHYIFRPKHLARTLFALVTNQRQYIQGHTGSGKTTLVEQVAARLFWPFVRINFDSEITRMDLIGRDTLTTDKDGNVTSVFEDGMLPRAMSGPYLCCFDEIDFCRPDVAYVMQSALEGNGLRITEDGDRMVKPHPMFRMFATGNTVGQGDEHGMYQGARPQSIAFLDRFTVWDKIDYLTADEREALLDRHYPALGKDAKKQILQYVTEHLEAFTTGKVIQPISPRGMLAVCRAAIMLGSVSDALGMTVLDRANTEDRATLKGLVDRVAR